MNAPKKMKLEDLKPQPVDLFDCFDTETEDAIDWDALDVFFNVDAPNALSKAITLTRIVAEYKILEIETIDNNIILSYLNKMADDTNIVSASLRVMHDDYLKSKQKYKGHYDENAHMFALNIAHNMHEWLEHYENTIGQTIEDVVNYINGLTPTQIKI